MIRHASPAQPVGALAQTMAESTWLRLWYRPLAACRCLRRACCRQAALQ